MALTALSSVCSFENRADPYNMMPTFAPAPGWGHNQHLLPHQYDQPTNWFQLPAEYGLVHPLDRYGGEHDPMRRKRARPSSEHGPCNSAWICPPGSYSVLRDPNPASVARPHTNKRPKTTSSQPKIERTYRCGYCSKEKKSASQSADGHVRIRCECGGQFRDGKTRLHATWVLISSPDDAPATEQPSKPVKPKARARSHSAAPQRVMTTANQPIQRPQHLTTPWRPQHLTTPWQLATPSISPTVSRPQTPPKASPAPVLSFVDETLMVRDKFSNPVTANVAPETNKNDVDSDMHADAAVSLCMLRA